MYKLQYDFSCDITFVYLSLLYKLYRNSETPTLMNTSKMTLENVVDHCTVHIENSECTTCCASHVNAKFYSSQSPLRTPQNNIIKNHYDSHMIRSLQFYSISNSFYAWEIWAKCRRSTSSESTCQKNNVLIMCSCSTLLNSHVCQPMWALKSNLLDDLVSDMKGSTHTKAQQVVTFLSLATPLFCCRSTQYYSII